MRGVIVAATHRAAFSHSASVGSRPPAQAQNASASYQLTPTTGWQSVCVNVPGGSPQFCSAFQYAGSVMLLFARQAQPSSDQ